MSARTSGSPPDLLALVRGTPELTDRARQQLVEWLDTPELAAFVPTIEALARDGDWGELEDAFYAHVAIGTGGIRGKLGPGPNRINDRTIAEAAQGLSAFIEEYGAGAKARGVVVGHEARRHSAEFARLCCEVFAANGIRAYLFDGIRATPEISFAVRYLRAIAGVQITASHNPRTDNGFKFYWSDGGQVVPPHDAKFGELVSQVREIQRLPFAEARDAGLVSILPPDVDREYLAAVRSLSIDPSRSATIVFSPIHGAGSTSALPVLRDEGFQVTTVPEQLEPDERFPTAVGDLINPEYREVMELPIDLAERTGADVAICTDPDADRVGVAARVHPDRRGVRFLTGNQVGAALAHYILERRRRRGALAPNHLVIETYVTTSLIGDIARDFGVRVVDDLPVGFKFIAELIGKLDDPTDFVFSAEESLGYLAGTFVRDKDGAIAALLVAEMASWLKDQRQTIVTYLDRIYETYGYYKNLQHVRELPGHAGRDLMTNVMVHLRRQPPERLAGRSVAVRDFLAEELRAPPRYRLGATGDMLSFVLSEDGRIRVTIRPSGTEPKLKYYVQHFASVDGDPSAGSGQALGAAKAKVDEEARSLAEAIVAYSVADLPDELRRAWDASVPRDV
ncbi:MAG: phospho-sugar mutase [Chloroflexi bacterium]|nr:phospho-sugar mutase [Chloroflexota bacterium]